MSECSACYVTDVDYNEWELRCPKCKCPFINFLDPEPHGFDGKDNGMYLGERVKCYECQHEFVVTENCWERND